MASRRKIRRFLSAMEECAAPATDSDSSSQASDDQSDVTSVCDREAEVSAGERGDEDGESVSSEVEVQSVSSGSVISDDSSSASDTPAGVREKVRAIFQRHSMSRECMADILHLLRDFDDSLPSDPRTLLRTPRAPVVHSKPEGDYVFHDVTPQIFLFERISEVTVLQVSADGIPVFRSAKQSAWVISLRLWCHQFATKPVVATVFVGSGKPELNFFYSTFVENIKKVVERYPNLRVVFVCDAQARSFSKGIVAHNSTHGCERCYTEGEYLERRMTFSCEAARSRTSESLREPLTEEDFEHRPLVSPLLQLPSLSLVSDFVLDYLHLVLLGAMRRLFQWWTNGPRVFRLPLALRANISDDLLRFRSFMTSDFSRKPRALTELNYWKASELRSFLCFYGPLVLRNRLPLPQYRNFIFLSAGIRLLCRTDLSEAEVEMAQHYLEEFVRTAREINGSVFVVYNIHSLLHLSCDYRSLGSLDHFSSFPFESFLFQIKKMVRHGRFPIQQISNRLSEQSSGKIEIEERLNRLKLSRDRYHIIGERLFEVKEFDNAFARGVFHKDEEEFIEDPCKMSVVGCSCFKSPGTRLVSLPLRTFTCETKVLALPFRTRKVVFRQVSAFQNM